MDQPSTHPPIGTPPTVETAPPQHAPVAEPAPGLRIHVWFGLITLIYAIDFADRFLVNAILPHIKAEFALSDAQSGLVGGIVYLGLLLMALPCGALVDRWSRCGMITVMTLAWSLATWATGLARNFHEILLARAAVGAGEAGYNPAGYALIAAWYPQRLRGLMVGLFNSAQPIGAGLGMVLAAWIADRWGWRHVFGVMAVPGIILGAVAWFAPDYKTKATSDPQQEVRGSFREALQYIRNSRTLLLLLLAQLPIGFYTISWSVWSTSFFTRTFQIPASQASSAVFVAILVAAVGPPVGGWLSDKLVRQTPAGRIWVGMGALAVLLVLHALLFAGAGRWLTFGESVVLVAIAQFFMAAHWGSLVVAGLDLTPPQFRGSAQAFIPLAQGLVAFWAAALTGWFSDQLGLATAMGISLLAGIGLGLGLLLTCVYTCAADDRQRQAYGDFLVEVPTTS